MICVENAGSNGRVIKEDSAQNRYIDFQDRLSGEGRRSFFVPLSQLEYLGQPLRNTESKGAIAAHKGEKVLIPINMRDGSVLAVGKGNPEWNYSAPHGAGRIMSRTKAKNELSLDQYKEEMAGVYTTSVNENTLDEAPMVYKSLEDIIDVIRESVDVIDVMKPIYNYKASD